MENIYWTGGFDSTFLVCKRLIIEKKPIQTYYLNFPCDGYQHNYNRFDSSNFHSCMIDNEINSVDGDPYGRKSYGRYSRLVEVKVMKKLRKMIIDRFPYTKDLFPKVNLIKELKIDSEVLSDAKVICDKYKSRPDRPDQSLYMIQFSLDLDKDISVAWEADMDGEDYCLSTRLVRKHLNSNKVSQYLGLFLHLINKSSINNNLWLLMIRTILKKYTLRKRKHKMQIPL